MEIQKFTTLEQLIQRWNPGLFIEEIDPALNLDIDRVMYRDKNGTTRYVCAVPKGGKYKSWLSMIAERRADSGTTGPKMGVAVQHRGLDGLVLTLIKKGYMTWESCQKFFGNEGGVADFVKGK